MRPRQPLPRLWMMTDERQGDGLFPALRNLPRGSGIVFRHYGLPLPDRRRLFERVKNEARRRGHVLILAGPPTLARHWGADGCHGGYAMANGMLKSRSVHNLRDLATAARERADFVFISPVFGTRSHPGAPSLGPLRTGLIVRAARMRVLALGGMNRQQAKRLRGFRIYGWAAIDAWADAPDQKRKAVPI